ncbi:polysaccharide biosynthesis/export family protein [Candidatus Thalassolituus haligoni]|uniref:polysaccharide biosynthesis/export family protein n=1 Tax=Candidatus Thalassolituus haligoni TaxID=3100113 RepID=UPI0035162C1F|tara:strand:- start:1243 stop:2853 length:1611 start_codon:yes stop_codon:yes gene_type:complete
MHFLLVSILLFWGLVVNALELSQGVDEFKSNMELDVAPSTPLYADWLFDGGFGEVSFNGLNPIYKVSQGDTLLVQIWGGVDFQGEVVVDPRGNIFIPRVGPINVQGVENKSLNGVVLKSIKRVFKSNVDAYVALLGSQTVKIFVSGMVEKPGIYEGQSADSILRYIDAAGGIKKNLGGYRNVQVIRQGSGVAKIDLYRFLKSGEMPDVQLQNGDLILVGSRSGYVQIEGDAGFNGRFELRGDSDILTTIVDYVALNESSTHVTLLEPDGTDINAYQYSLNSIKGVVVKSGSRVKFSSQLRPRSISVEVVGEHNSSTEMVLPWGSTLDDLINQIEFSALSDRDSLQLYRASVAKRQKEMLMASLSALEQSVLTARSATRETAELRKAEAETVLQWVERAKKIQPKGQVVLLDGYDPAKIVLDQGDKVVVPIKRNLVMIHGEVLFPTAVSYQSKMNIKNYVDQAGGATSELSGLNVLIMKSNGTFVRASSDLGDKKLVQPGDEIFVLAKPKLKALQLTKDISQVIYQIAVSAAVALAL